MRRKATHVCSGIYFFVLSKGPEDLRQLVYELNEVVDWYHLGLHLEIPDVELQIIAKDHPQDTKMCRTKMLSWWMNNVEERKWATIVHALVRTGSRFLASKIALKYGIPSIAFL